MGAPKDRKLQEARDAFSALAAEIARQTRVALDLTDDQIKADFACNAKDAPMRAHLLTKLSASLAKAATTDAAVVGGSFNITVLGSADNNEQWLEMAAPFRKQISELREKPIDVVIPDAVKVPAK